MKEDSLRSTPKITLYSADWCTKCRNLKRALSALKLDYEVIDIDETKDDTISELPTLEFNSHRYSGELSIRELKEIFKDILKE